jgi:hypothetical protein
MPRKKQRQKEVEEPDWWQRVKILALIADAIARLLDAAFDRR